MANKSVSAQLVIKASPEKIFDLLADPTKHSLIDGSGSVKAGRPGNPKRLSLGAKFSMDMRIKLPYRISNTVVEFEE
ncbi:MAG: dimethyladenosine transferase, partial [Actinobacteria bacterium]|nr:dimethyladenosine transferase [Actinomycetota bacterium]